MALKPCRECRTKISTEAKRCPHCGAPSPMPTPEQEANAQFYQWVIGLGAFVVLIVLVGMCRSDRPAVEPTTTEWAGPPIVNVLEIVGRTPDEVIASFGQPDSIRDEQIELGGLTYPVHYYESFEVVFADGRGEWVTVWGRDTLPFSDAVLPALGLQDAEPTFANPAATIRWERHPEVREVAVFPDTTMEKAHYAYIIYRRPMRAPTR